MSVNSHLTSISDDAIIRDSEKNGIKRSVDTIHSRLKDFFGANINEKFVFGSYDRGTILPRKMDDESDVDLMVVFVDTSSKPQTYLDRLKRFADARYSTSVVGQSSPAIVLELDHIKFELVPAIKTYAWDNNYQIPDKVNSYRDWISTDPTAFNKDLTEANQNNKNLIRPLIRVLKYWNAYKDHPLSSFSLESNIVSKYRWGNGSLQNLEGYFIDYVKGLVMNDEWSQEVRDKVDRLKSIVSNVSLLESQNRPDSAEAELKKIIPAVK